MKILIALTPILLTGCMAANPARPVLTCNNCGDLTYYGPQQPDPRVEMARVLTGGLSSVAGIVVGGDVLKSLGSASGATSTIERTTNNNSVTDRSVSDSISDTSVTDVRVSDSVSNTSVSDISSVNNNTSVSDISSISNTSVSDTSSVSNTSTGGL